MKPLQIINDLVDVPTFRNEIEEADFWGTHRLSDALLAQMQPLAEDAAPPARATQSVTPRMDSALLARLRALARRRHMPYQRLLKQFVEERLQQEEVGAENGMQPASLADPEAVRRTARSIAKLARDLESAVASLT